MFFLLQSSLTHRDRTHIPRCFFCFDRLQDCDQIQSLGSDDPLVFQIRSGERNVIVCLAQKGHSQTPPPHTFLCLCFQRKYIQTTVCYFPYVFFLKGLGVGVFDLRSLLFMLQLYVGSYVCECYQPSSSYHSRTHWHLYERDQAYPQV